jgi:hypothetical protein
MHPRITLNSRILSRLTIPVVQKGHIHVTPVRPLATVGSGPTTDQMHTPRPKTKWGLDRDMLYIGGGLVAIGGIWYYYAMAEHARIEKRRERLDPGTVTANAADTAQTAKGRAQETFKNAR